MDGNGQQQEPPSLDFWFFVSRQRTSPPGERGQEKALRGLSAKSKSASWWTKLPKQILHFYHHHAILRRK